MRRPSITLRELLVPLLLLLALAFGLSLQTRAMPTVQADEPTPTPERTLPPSDFGHSSSAPGSCTSHGGSHLYEYINDVTYSFDADGRMKIVVGIWIANPTGCKVGQPCPEYDNSPEYVNAWVDWDGDKVFESSERVMDQAGTGYRNINYSGRMSFFQTVAVPGSAASPIYMRVNLGWGHDPNDPCELYWTWGDIKDYGINFAAWRSDIQPGDLLLEHGSGIIGWIIPGYWDHVGIYVGNNQVVEAGVVKDGNTVVGYSSISDWDYPRRNRHPVELLRVSGATQSVRDGVVKFVKNQVGKPYEMPYWGKESDASSPSWYCSELAWAAYLSQGINIESTPDPAQVTPIEIHNDNDTYRVNGHGKMGSFPWNPTYPQDTEPKALVVTAHSPVDIVVTDPDGLVFTKDLQQIPLGTYIETDLDGDGDVEDIVVIAEAKNGYYAVNVVPEPGAAPTDRYTLEVEAYGASVILAQDTQISDIPTEPYLIEVTDAGVILQVDKTPPVTTATYNPASPDGERNWYKSDVIVSLAAVDPDPGDGSPVSGVAATYYRLNGGAWQDYTGPFTIGDEGWNILEWYSVDNADNVEATHEFRFKLDKTRPEISITEGILDGLHWDQVHLERGILTNTDTLALSGNATDNLCLWEVRAVDTDTDQVLASQQPDGANTPDWPPPYPPDSLAYSLNVPLHTGINNIDVVAEDCAGWEKSIATQVVYVVPGPYDPRTKGFWYNAVKTGKYTDGQMQTLLDYANVVSDTWGPAPRNIYGKLTLANYGGILNTTSSNMETLQEAQLLATWLNLVSGRVAVLTPADLSPVAGWAQVVDNTGGSPLTFAMNVPMEVEEVDQTRLATRAVYQIAKNLLDAFNNRRIIP